MKNIVSVFLLFSLLLPVSLSSQTPLWQGKGRIAVSSDGNEHDNDDWGATPMTLALLAAKGLQDKLVLYVYSDHVWGSNREMGVRYGMTAYEHMREAALGGQRWFGFDKTRFVCGVDNAEVAYEAMKDVINDSSEESPLIIVAAGPLQVIGEAIARANRDKLKYVTVVSHGRWNAVHADNPSNIYWDFHTGWTLNRIKETFATRDIGLKIIMPANQNGGPDYEGFRSKKENFEWIKTSPARNNPLYKQGAWDWLYSRVAVTVRISGEMGWSGESGTHYDVSDAGQIAYILTGIDKTNINMAREIMENPEPRK